MTADHELSTVSSHDADLRRVLLPHPLAALLLVDIKAGRGFPGMSLHSLVDRAPHPLDALLIANIPLMAHAASLHPALAAGLADALLSSPATTTLNSSDARALSDIRLGGDQGILHVCVDIVATCFEPPLHAKPPTAILDKMGALATALESVSPGTINRTDAAGRSFLEKFETLERLGLPPLPALDRLRLSNAGHSNGRPPTARSF